MDRTPPVESGSRVAARDAALSLLSRLRRWLLVASFALVAAFAGLLAHAKPGKSSGVAASSSGGSSSGSRPSQPLTEGGGGAAAPAPAPEISPPVQAPLPAPAAPAPPVVSGGS